MDETTLAGVLAKMNQKNEALEQTIATLMQTLADKETHNVTVKQAEIEPAVVRADKVSKIGDKMIRSNRLKIYKLTSEMEVKLFIKKFDE